MIEIMRENKDLKGEKQERNDNQQCKKKNKEEVQKRILKLKKS